ncbi:autotransporter outer membrane beta-barrel domain-containing protein [Pseudomonas sp. R5(2019)]|uniref:autotransporter outer membrane beta-barrel domain-containing protein n=1 Tax=Pseudomonas sp. R5(2019) TaxID=2697566 RepID=UPI0014120CA6|nr:autotransporter outer membrane beta-barrel domain-containing protein [Pseudomonas sp. R5(2019)]NBA97392.1 autotransporter outer membrane beta-barrel domain-containing protein [Pseudomonas sp. R5(2019)]
MKSHPGFLLRPLYQSLRWVPVVPLLMFTEQALALNTINGIHVSINSTTATDAYALINGATLTADGAQTQSIESNDSTLVFNGSTATTASGDGITLRSSQATIAGSSVTSTGTALILSKSVGGLTGASADVTGSTLTGGRIGVLVGNGDLTVSGSQIVATAANGMGLRLAQGSATVSGSLIQGGEYGVQLLSGFDNGQNRLELSNSQVRGVTGAALVVQNLTSQPTSSEILVSNGSQLISGNGNVLEVRDQSTAHMTVDASDLLGNVVVTDGARADLVLQNKATLTGQLENVASLGLNSGGAWHLVGDSQVGDLNMAGGSVKFGEAAQFYTLSVANLSGNGTFVMDADFAKGQVDHLEVTGTATGNHQLAINSSGADPLADTQLHVVHAAAGDANFALAGGRVDLGTWSYDLLQSGNDWYLASNGTISPAAASVMALFNTAPTVWYGELTSLRSRMGELRLDDKKAGGWIRAYGNKYNVSASSGVGYQQTQNGFSIGADAPLGEGWLLGVMAGHSQSDLSLKHGTSGEVSSSYVGGYLTWMDDASGYFADAVLKLNHFSNKADVAMSDGQQVKGDYTSHAVGLSGEFGRRITLANDYFVEPSVQLSAVRISGESYDLDNGLQAKGDSSHSLLGKVGATAGRHFDLSEGRTVEPYVRAAWVHEFAKNNEVNVNSNVFDNDLSGSRAEVGVGIAASLGNNFQLHSEFDYSHGSKIEQPFGVSVGLRYLW